MSLSMSRAEREEFLAGLHVAVKSSSAALVRLPGPTVPPALATR